MEDSPENDEPLRISWRFVLSFLTIVGTGLAVVWAVNYQDAFGG